MITRLITMPKVQNSEETLDNVAFLLGSLGKATKHLIANHDRKSSGNLCSRSSKRESTNTIGTFCTCFIWICMLESKWNSSRAIIYIRRPSIRCEIRFLDNVSAWGVSALGETRDLPRRKQKSCFGAGFCDANTCSGWMLPTLAFARFYSSKSYQFFINYLSITSPFAEWFIDKVFKLGIMHRPSLKYRSSVICPSRGAIELSSGGRFINYCDGFLCDFCFWLISEQIFSFLHFAMKFGNCGCLVGVLGIVIVYNLDLIPTFNLQIIICLLHFLYLSQFSRIMN